MSYLFTGFAANYSAKQVFRHLFAVGKPQHSADLNSALKKRYNGKAVHLYSSGRSALTAAIKASVPAGSYVAIPGLTCYAVVQAVHAADCNPIYLDISSKTYNYGTKELLRALSKQPKIKAIVVQNMLGLSQDIVALEKIASKRSIAIIEDLAHCAGAHYPDGREVGTVGTATALSFGKGKSLDTVRGGAVILRQEPVRLVSEPTHLPKLKSRLQDRFYPLIGLITRGLYHIHLGKLFAALSIKIHLISRSADGRVTLNTKLPDWQAKLALKQLGDLDLTVKSRIATAARVITRLGLDPIPAGSVPIRVPFLFTDPDEALTALRAQHFHLDEIWYDTPVSPKRNYKKVKFPEADCPCAVAVSEHIMNIPTYYPIDKLDPAIKLIKELP